MRSPRGLADGIAHIGRGQKGNLHFPFGAKDAPTDIYYYLKYLLPKTPTTQTPDEELLMQCDPDLNHM